MTRLWTLALVLLIAPVASASAGDLVLYGAGSLKGGMTEQAQILKRAAA